MSEQLHQEHVNIRRKLSSAHYAAWDREAGHMRAWQKLESEPNGDEWRWHLQEALRARQEQLALKALMEEWT